jgi:hypothetical protein
VIYLFLFVGYDFFLRDDARFEVDPPFFDARFFATLRLARFFGTLAPSALASDNPMAIACLRLLTFLPERPLLSVPRFLSCMAFSTFLEAFLEYFAIV